MSEMGRTLRLRSDLRRHIQRAAEILRSGGTVAFPTETVYGLGANALDPAAVAAIFTAKQRPSWDPLIVHISDPEMLGRVVELTGELRDRATRLTDAFWPGPLTLLLPRSPTVPDAVTAGRRRVGVRMPDHQVAMDLIRRTGIPVAAPSANRFGHTSPTTAGHVLRDLDGRVDAVLDGGPTSVGIESTVLDVCESPMVIYRPGAVTPSMIAEVAGADVRIYQAPTLSDPPAALPSPGVGLRHYAPRATLVLVRETAIDPHASLQLKIAAHAKSRVGVMLPTGWDPSGAGLIYDWGPWGKLDLLARRLFAGLRSLDEGGADVIVCPLPSAGGLGDALRDRLEKAARSA